MDMFAGLSEQSLKAIEGMSLRFQQLAVTVKEVNQKHVDLQLAFDSADLVQQDRVRSGETGEGVSFGSQTSSSAARADNFQNTAPTQSDKGATGVSWLLNGGPGQADNNQNAGFKYFDTWAPESGWLMKGSGPVQADNFQNVRVLPQVKQETEAPSVVGTLEFPRPVSRGLGLSEFSQNARSSVGMGVAPGEARPVSLVSDDRESVLGSFTPVQMESTGRQWQAWSRIRVPEYKGDIRWDSFIVQFRTIMKMHGCADDDMMVCKLVESLRGPALNFYRSLPGGQRSGFVSLCSLFEEDWKPGSTSFDAEQTQVYRPTCG